MKRSDYLAIFISIVIILIAMMAVSCNPVKQVLRNRASFEKVKNEVIRLGLCANDTIINNISDTLVTMDTIIYVDQETIVKNDTTYISSIKYKNIVKKITIRDTIKSVIVDNARIKVLEADYNKMKLTADECKAKAEKWLNWLILLIVGIGLWIFFKIKP
jgi:succinylarginine dihydrolase